MAEGIRAVVSGKGVGDGRNHPCDIDWPFRVRNRMCVIVGRHSLPGDSTMSVDRSSQRVKGCHVIGLILRMMAFKR